MVRLKVMKNIPLLKSKDLILVSVLLLVALLFYLIGNSSEKGQIATVATDGEVVTVIDLSSAENETFAVNNTVIEIKDGMVAFVDSNCSDKTCVKTGALKNDGDVGACVPNKVSVVVSGDSSKQDFDVVAY